MYYRNIDLKVNYRIGSLEIFIVIHYLSLLVNYRIGSLEK